ncbi:MAG: phosphoribosylaminoimidazolesuccinocarboxamide synthase [Selenomonadaceae bacterium]|nr:phosphoribosylaminoimidazolesuccinocarboxamide synthase [Selenomonadaceae bacterium]MBR3721397.1 phosphoribosylaminoimidazolesuccinocarboxamide synthase [Selenomonadaceae bacterium]
MTARAQMLNMVELVPEAKIPLVIEVLKHFISYEEDDDIATPDDIIAHELALKEYAAGETISHDMIDWN